MLSTDEHFIGSSSGNQKHLELRIRCLCMKPCQLLAKPESPSSTALVVSENAKNDDDVYVQVTKPSSGHMNYKSCLSVTQEEIV